MHQYFISDAAYSVTESANFAPPFVKVFGGHNFIMSTRGCP
nr:MAG TPA: hypothetical protein [Caudoviricetes sp.]